MEWFDFAVYGYFAKEVGEAFFPADVPSLQLLQGLSVGDEITGWVVAH